VLDPLPIEMIQAEGLVTLHVTRAALGDLGKLWAYGRVILPGLGWGGQAVILNEMLTKQRP
jgi:hypothetical protein